MSASLLWPNDPGIKPKLNLQWNHRGPISEKLDVFGLHMRDSDSKDDPDIQSTLPPVLAPSSVPSPPHTQEALDGLVEGSS